MVNGIIDGMDIISAVDGYCRGAVFLYVVELVKIKRNEHPFPVVRLYSVILNS